MAFNAMVAGTVTLATVYHVDVILTVSSWFFGFEAAMYLLAVLLSSSDRFTKDVFDKPGTLQPWKAIVEPVWVIYMFGLGHIFNGVCMAFTALTYVYLVVSKYAKKSEAQD